MVCLKFLSQKKRCCKATSIKKHFSIKLKILKCFLIPLPKTSYSLELKHQKFERFLRAVVYSNNLLLSFLFLDPEKSGFNPPCFNSEIKNPDFSVCKELKTLGVLTQSSSHTQKRIVRFSESEVFSINFFISKL